LIDSAEQGADGAALAAAALAEQHRDEACSARDNASSKLLELQ